MSLKVAVIGCGKIAQVRHIPEYLANPEAEIAGYFDINFERAKGLADKFGGKAYKSLDELFSDRAIDAVSVCSANAAHAQHAINALRAGKHVLCEKPMAIDIADCEAMVKEAERAGRKLMIDQNQRLVKTHQKAKALIAHGTIGKVVTFKTSFGHGGPETWSIDPGKATWFFDKKTAVLGAMADLGIHKTDLIQYILNSKVVETEAKVVTLDKTGPDGKLIGVDDNAICIYTLENGVVGTMTASWTYYGYEDNSTVIYGTKGIMRIYDIAGCPLKIVLRDGGEIDYKLDQIQTNDNQTSSGIINSFVNYINGDESAGISGESVLNAMRAVFASVESSAKGCAVKVNI